jgi:hypothetical protein
MVLVLVALGVGLGVGFAAATGSLPQAFQEAVEGFPTDPPFDDTRAAAFASVWPTGTHAIPLPRLFVDLSPGARGARGESAPGADQGALDRARDWQQAVASQLIDDSPRWPLITLTASELLLGDTRVMTAAEGNIEHENEHSVYPRKARSQVHPLALMLGAIGREPDPSRDEKLRERFASDAPLGNQIERLFTASREDLQQYFLGKKAPPAPGARPDLFLERRVRVALPGDTPYQTLLALLDSAAHEGFRECLLLTEGPALAPRREGSRTEGPALAPRRGAILWEHGRGVHGHATAAPVVQIDLLVVPEGVALRTDEGPVGPGCTAGEGLTFPREPASPTALADCLRQLYAARPEAQESNDAIWADPGLPVHRIYETLLLLQPLLLPWRAAGLDADGHYPRLFAAPAPSSIEEWQRNPPPARGGQSHPLAAGRHGRLPPRVAGSHRPVSSPDFPPLPLGLAHSP